MLRLQMGVEDAEKNLMRVNEAIKDIKKREKLWEVYALVVGAVRLTNSELDEVLVNGVNWAIEHGYGSSHDSDVCEENGKKPNADPNKVSDKARKKKRGIN